MDIKDQMIEAYERGETSYEGAYDYVRDRMADSADRLRTERKEAGTAKPTKTRVRGLKDVVSKALFNRPHSGTAPYIEATKALDELATLAGSAVELGAKNEDAPS